MIVIFDHNVRNDRVATVKTPVSSRLEVKLSSQIQNSILTIGHFGENKDHFGTGYRLF